MKLFVRAIVTGFGLAIGAAIFRKVSPLVGLDDKAKPKNDDEIQRGDGGTDPALRHS